MGIMERNNRINLPMVGSFTNATAKPLLLDSLFPFDPYMLKDSKSFVDNIYRPFTGEFLTDDSDEKEERRRRRRTVRLLTLVLGEEERDVTVFGPPIVVVV